MMMITYPEPVTLTMQNTACLRMRDNGEATREHGSVESQRGKEHDSKEREVSDTGYERRTFVCPGDVLSASTCQSVVVMMTITISVPLLSLPVTLWEICNSESSIVLSFWRGFLFIVCWSFVSENLQTDTWVISLWLEAISFSLTPCSALCLYATSLLFFPIWND